MKRLFYFITALILLPSVAAAQAYPATTCVSATPVADLAAYATGDLIGGKLTFTGALRNTSNAGFVVSVAVLDKAAQAIDLELVVFNSNPTGTTFTDQAAFDPADTDLDKVAFFVLLDDAQRAAWSDNGFQYLGSLAYPVGGTATAGTTLYGALVARGAYDGASASDLTVTICTSQD